MSGALIRGGRVVDGLGGQARTEDVRVRGDRIVEMGTNLKPDGEQEFDAANAIVVPGFIDAHTHLDPWLWRDPSFEPLPQHGVTTVVTGNCSLSLAPIDADNSALIDMFAYIEDVPADVMAKAVPWHWQSWGDYVRQAAKVPSTVHIAPLVGLSQIRHVVMGEAAFERAATDAECDAIVGVVRTCLDEGACGVSLSFIDTDSSGRPVPSRLADDAELTAVMTAIVEAGHGIAGFNGAYDQVERMGCICKATGVAATWVQLITHSSKPQHHRNMLAQAARLRADGANIRPQVSPRPLLFQLNFTGTIQFMGLDLWNEFANAPIDRKRELVADEAWRERARHEWDHGTGTMFPRDDLASVAIIPTAHDRDPAGLPKTLAELHAQRGGHPSDLLLDWTAEHDMAPGLIVTVANDDVDLVAEALCDPNTLIAASDVGAHMQMMAAQGDPSLLLTRHVMERGDMTLEEAIRRMTSEPAEFLGLTDRGVLAVGKRADIAIIDLGELEYLPEELAYGLLGDGAGHFTRPAKGIRATLADGVATQIGGVLTGARPAGLIPARRAA